MCKRSPCKECPYRKDSLPGYLGEASFQPELFLQQLELPEVHPCHLSVDWEKDEGREGHICIGSLQFMNNSFKQHQYQKIRDLQKEVGKSEEVISFPGDFIKHHSR